MIACGNGVLGVQREDRGGGGYPIQVQLRKLVLAASYSPECFGFDITNCKNVKRVN